MLSTISVDPGRGRIGPISGPQRRVWNPVLLPVVFQHLLAGHADFGAVLLKAGQNGEVALIHHSAAVTLNIAGASLLLLRRAAALLLLGQGAGGNRYRQQGECEKKLVHRVPSL